MNYDDIILAMLLQRADMAPPPDMGRDPGGYNFNKRAPLPPDVGPPRGDAEGWNEMAPPTEIPPGGVPGKYMFGLTDKMAEPIDPEYGEGEVIPPQNGMPQAGTEMQSPWPGYPPWFANPYDRTEEEYEADPRQRMPDWYNRSQPGPNFDYSPDRDPVPPPQRIQYQYTPEEIQMIQASLQQQPAEQDYEEA